MTDHDGSKKGHREAGTPAILPSQAELAAAMADLAEKPADQQLGLFIDNDDRLAQAAEQSNAIRRGAGRPEGSTNRRNSDLFDLAEARGYKHPFWRLMEIISADPRELAAALAGYEHVEEVSFAQAMAVLDKQRSAAETLLPFDLAKKPQSIEVKGQSLHVFVAGKLSDIKAGTAGFSLTGEIVEQNQGASGTVGQEPVGQANNSQQDQEVKPVKPAD